jgi:hypothetical protein
MMTTTTMIDGDDYIFQRRGMGSVLEWRRGQQFFYPDPIVPCAYQGKYAEPST